jgi:hypothetical protein
MDQVSQMMTDGQGTIASAAPRDEFSAKVDHTISEAQRALLQQQHPEGYWQGALEANAEMNAEYIIFNRFMEVEPDPALDAKLKKLLIDTQQGDGSWSLFPGGEGNVSTTIEAYFALKLTGMRAGDEPMMQARRWILARGGISSAGTLARFYLAAMNQVEWDATPAMPVEITLLPNWFPVNMYELSSWARGTLFALMVLQAKRPARAIDWIEGVLELYIEPPHFTKFKMPRGKSLFSLRNALIGADKVLRSYEHHHLSGLRARALRHAENWLLEHQDANGSWGGIQPCYLLSPMALKGLGYRNDHPVIEKALAGARELIWDQDDTILYQPCVSPNWDTALAAKALIDSGFKSDHPALRDAAKWLIDHQIFKPGDWSIKRPDLEPGGWAFQFHNDWYPDGAGRSRPRRLRYSRSCDPARRKLGDGNAVEGRWICRLRYRQRFKLDQPGAVRRRRGRDRPHLCRLDRARARNDGCGGLSCGSSGGAPRDYLAQARSEVGRFVVGSMGRQLYLRDFLGIIGSARDWRGLERAADYASGHMAEIRAKSRWRLGRDLPRRQGTRAEGQRYEHAVADRLGVDRINRGRGRDQRQRDARRRLADRAAKQRRPLGRCGVYWHWIPQPFLSSLPHVRALLSADGARSIPPADGGTSCALRFCITR